MFFDTHLHISPWSGDAVQTLSDLDREITQKDLIGGCLTDHYDKDMYYGRDFEDIFDPDKYFHHLSSCRIDLEEAKTTGRPAFLLGVELGWWPYLTPHLDELVAKYPFDCVILSLHVLDGRDPFSDSDFYEAGFEDIYSRAIDRMTEMTLSGPDYDILGHFDYVSRYSLIDASKMLYEHAPASFDRLFKAMIAQGKCLEINSGTIRVLARKGYLANDIYPDPAIIKRYLELGGQFISLGSDAHASGQTAAYFPELSQWLRNFGLKELTYFVERKAVKYPLPSFT